MSLKDQLSHYTEHDYPIVEGDIYALIYADKEERQSGGGFFSKVFR